MTERRERDNITNTMETCWSNQRREGGREGLPGGVGWEGGADG